MLIACTEKDELNKENVPYISQIKFNFEVIKLLHQKPFLFMSIAWKFKSMFLKICMVSYAEYT